MRLIDGDALLKKLKTAEEGSMVVVKHIQKHEVYSAESIALTTFSIVEDVINNAPTIDPVQHGRWKVITFHNGCTPDYDCVCSECGASSVPYHKYCYNCGAQIDNVDDPDE